MGHRLICGLFGRSSSKSMSKLATMAKLALLTEEGHPRLGLALTKVELAIIEQKTLDAYAMIEVYCHLLIERIEVIRDNKECPSELKEMAASLIFAASRCGRLPELEKIRQMLTSKYGKDFAYNAIEIRNNCGVHPKMVNKLSPLPASMEAKQNLLKKIAKDNNIAYDIY
ncbi:hypothetical protein AAHA92_12483 [Salvia divinorum]|uniref:IST1-like protein n=1 Tax=Salvia divinorum TaxID=28513 RepID=A0ABD1HPI7_SALDI